MCSTEHNKCSSSNKPATFIAQKSRCNQRGQGRAVHAERVDQLLQQGAHAEERLLRHEKHVPAQPPAAAAAARRHRPAHVRPEVAQDAHEAAFAAAVGPRDQQVAARADGEAAVLHERRAGGRDDGQAVEPQEAIVCTDGTL